MSKRRQIMPAMKAIFDNRRVLEKLHSQIVSRDYENQTLLNSAKLDKLRVADRNIAEDLPEDVEIKNFGDTFNGNFRSYKSFTPCIRRPNQLPVTVKNRSYKPYLSKLYSYNRPLKSLPPKSFKMQSKSPLKSLVIRNTKILV